MHKTQIHNEAAAGNNPSKPAARPTNARWRLPAELAHSAPRAVRLSAAGRVLAVCAVAMVAGAMVSGIGFYVNGERNRALRARLAREGITLQAQVVDTGRTRGEDKHRFIVYGYVVGSEAYERRQILHDRDSRTLDIGDAVAVRYLVDKPAIAWIVGYEPDGVPRWVGVVVPAILLFLAWLLAALLRRQRRLLSEGRAVAARVVASTKVHTGHRTSYRVEYEFQIMSGATRRMRLEGARAREAGACVTVIYDRENSRKVALYPLTLVTVAQE
jgi:Protein of unknown function (DUF3592)